MYLGNASAVNPIVQHASRPGRIKTPEPRFGLMLFGRFRQWLVRDELDRINDSGAKRRRVRPVLRIERLNKIAALVRNRFGNLSQVPPTDRHPHEREYQRQARLALVE